MVIPERWSKKQLCDVVSMKSGDTITAERISDNEKYPCYGGNGLRGYTDRYTHDGEYALIGRQGALCGNVNYASGKFYASEHAVVVTPHVDTDIRFMYYLLTAMNLNKYSTSSAQPGLAVNKILELECVLPDNKSEQIAVAIALSDIDKLISTQENLIAKKKAIKQGAMQKLLSGKRRMSGFMEVWNRHNLEEFVDFCTASIGLDKIDAREYVGTDNMLSGLGGIKCNELSLQYSTVREYKENDILISNIRPYLQKAWLADRNGGCSNDVLVLRSKDINKYMPLFLYYLLTDGRFFDYATETATGSKMPRGDKAMIKAYELCVPNDIEEQKAIAVAIERMDKDLINQKDKLEKLELIKSGMMDNLLTGKIRLTN